MDRDLFEYRTAPPVLPSFGKLAWMLQPLVTVDEWVNRLHQRLTRPKRG